MAGLGTQLGQAPAGKRYNTAGQLEDIPGGQSATEPVFGTPQGYPTAGVDPSQIYGTAAQLKGQSEAEQATSALSKQNYEQSVAARNDLLGKLPGIASSMGVGGPGGSVTYGSNMGGVTPASLQAAQESAFARAKDASGTTARAALNQLRDLYAGSDMTDSGGFLAREGQIVSGAAGQQGEMNREQLIQNLAQLQHAADTTYQGDITQRGQNIQAMQGLLSAIGNAGRLY